MKEGVKIMETKTKEIINKLHTNNFIHKSTKGYLCPNGRK